MEGSLKTGDQLVAVNGVSVRGLSFDDCLSKIVDVEVSRKEREGTNQIEPRQRGHRQILSPFFNDSP